MRFCAFVCLGCGCLELVVAVVLQGPGRPQWSEAGLRAVALKQALLAWVGSGAEGARLSPPPLSEILEVFIAEKLANAADPGSFLPLPWLSLPQLLVLSAPSAPSDCYVHIFKCKPAFP